MKTIALIALFALLNGLLAWLDNLPQEVGPDVPQGKLNSLSFAPYREGQGPMDAIFPNAAHIEDDMRLMSAKTHSIRTYASAEGTMPLIPELARKYGLAMIQGAWLGGVAEANQVEIDALIRSANANPDVVKRVIVGNEVLLRNDLPIDALINAIRTVKRAVKQPVSYADVWSMYMKHPELIKEVDFITIHILPYWEDEPIPVAEAPAHIERIYQHVRKVADGISPNKPILIGESGWPGEGRQRGGAVPSVTNEATFIRGLIKVANANGFDYNIVEAINQSWKYALEGVVGANWGLFSVDRKEVFPLTGKVHENPDWPKHLLTSIAIFLIAATILWRRLQTLTTLQAGCLLALIQVLAVLWTTEAELLWYTSYNNWQRLATASILTVSALTGGLAIQRGHALLTRQSNNPKITAGLYNLLVLSAGYAAYKTACLAVNGRYISFPIEVVYLAVASIFGLMAMRYLSEQTWSWRIADLTGYILGKPGEHKILAYTLFGTGLGLIIGETFAFFVSNDLILAYPEVSKRLSMSLCLTLSNRQLLIWLACLAILAMPLISGQKSSAPQPQP